MCYIKSQNTNRRESMYFMGGRSMEDTNAYCHKKCRNLMVDGKLQCQCGETEGLISWSWDGESCNSSNTVISNGQKEVLFHPVFSSGTAVVRGTEVLDKNKHYYFEVKILTFMYGTDIMIGVGTPKINLSEWKNKFCSMLGDDDQSWGYSYQGSIQHMGMKRSYGDKFGMGSLIGVHVDMCRGRLEYYLNRQPLGIAFTELKNVDLYPMVCSTAAQSAIRLTCSMVFESSLQFQCLRTVGRNPNVFNVYKNIPGLSKLVHKEHFWLIPPYNSQVVNEDITELHKLELEDEAVIPLETIIKGKSLRKNMKLNKWGRYVINESELTQPKTTNYILKSPTAGLKFKRQIESHCYRKIVDKLRKSLIKEKRSVCELCKVVSCVCPSEKFELQSSLPERMDVKDDVDIYGDLPNVGSACDDGRYCMKCSFKLGTHEECKKDVLCSICDIII